MSLYLNRKNNLADVENICEARKNIGIGTLAYQDSNNVKITGGSIKIDELILNSSNAKPNRFLICKSNNGLLDFVDLEFADWINQDASTIPLSSFNYDMMIVNRNSLCNIAFTNDYNDLINKPQNLSDLNNDLSFLQKDLGNVDVEQAISNLKLGTLAFKNEDDHIYLKNLTITESFRFTGNLNLQSDEPQYLHISSTSNAYWAPLTKASSSNYGVVKLNDDFRSSNINTAPSSKAINDMYEYFVSIIDGITDISEVQEVEDKINELGLLRKVNNLSEFKDSDLNIVRNNLGFDTYMNNFINNINNNNKFSINELVVNCNIVFRNQGNFAQGDPFLGLNTFLSVLANGNVEPRSLPLAQQNVAGFVYIANDINDITANKEYTVLSMKGLHDYHSNVYQANFDALSNSIEPKIRQIFSEYIRIDENLKVDNPSIARTNLQLHPVAHTGDYYQLNNRPTNVSQFSNDVGYLIASSNLADILNIQEARSNLRIGNISYYDSNNVLILDGNATFSNLNVRQHFQYKYNDDNYQGCYLQSIDVNGNARWRPLPLATSTKKGVVKLESDISVYSEEHASSAAALFKVYERLNGKIDIINDEILQLKKELNII
jgi:hypothetical protein